MPYFLIIKSMKGANCSSDQIIIKSTIKLLVRQRMRQDKMPITKLAIKRIKINRVRDDLQALLNDRDKRRK